MGDPTTLQGFGIAVLIILFGFGLAILKKASEAGVKWFEIWTDIQTQKLEELKKANELKQQTVNKMPDPVTPAPVPPSEIGI